jgi:hypothetical protein
MEKDDALPLGSFTGERRSNFKTVWWLTIRTKPFPGQSNGPPFTLPPLNLPTFNLSPS